MIELKSIALDHVHASPNNPRRTFVDATLAELASSIREQGVLQPILVRPLPMDRGPSGMAMSEKLNHFEIVAGHRRLRASRMAGLAEIPAIVREMDNVAALEAAVLENLQREDVHPLEEAEGYERLMKSGNYSLEHLLERIGKSRSYVYGRLKLLALEPKAREAFYAGKLTPSTALLIARLPADKQQKALDEIIKCYGGVPLSFRSARDHIERNFMLNLTKAPFKVTDDRFAAGPCTACPKRTGNQPELFADASSGDLCTDARCFNDKRETDYLRKKALVEEKGAKVIEGAAAKKIAPLGAGYIEPKTGYVALSQTCYEAPKCPSYEKLLGKDFTPDTYIRDPRTGSLVPVAKKTTIQEHLEAKGITIPTSRDEGDKERERKAKAETSYREALLRSISAELAGGYEPSTADLRLIAETLYERIGHDNRKRLEKLFGERDIEQLEHEQLFILLLQCALIGEVHVSGYMTIGKPERLLAIADAVKIDHAALKREAQKALKPAKKSTKKPATKAASTPTHAAQAADRGAPAAPRPKKPVAKKAKAETNRAPAAPGNEKPSDTQPAAPSVAPMGAWPFPTERT